MSSTLQIQAAEEAARHQFENLPEHLVASLRVIVTTTNLEQQREREECQLQYKEISAQNQVLINLVVKLYNNQPRKRGKGSSKSESFHSLNLPSMRLIVNIVQSPLTLSSTETPSRLSMTIQPRLLTTSDGSDNRGTSIMAFGSTDTSPNIMTDVDENLLGESIVPGSSPLSSSSQLSDMQLKAMEELKMKYGPECVQKHEWKWATYSSRQKDEWIPVYVLATKLSLEETYIEYMTGWQGCFSVKMLRDTWEAKWQFGDWAQISEATWQAKLYHLIEALKEKNVNWKDQHVFRFLAQEFPIKPGSSDKHLWNVHAFLEWLQSKKEDGFNKVVSASVGYHLVLV